MSKELVISATPHETRVAIVEDGQLCEIYIEREKEFALVGSLYKGRVTRVLPGMQSAFVDIGLDSDAFLYVSDFLEHLEDYDHVAAPEPKAPKVEKPANEVFAPSTTNGGVQNVDPDQSGRESETPSGYVSSGTPAEPSESDAAPASAVSETAEAVPTGPAIIPLEGESISGGSGGHSSGSDTSVQRARPPFEQSGTRGNNRGNDRGNNRGRGGSNDRGGRGGRNNRFGRSGGGRDRGGRRDLPPSKYASPRPFDSKPRESAPYEPAPVDPNFEPIILPGESLAKYKNRPPARTVVSPTDAAKSGKTSEHSATQGDQHDAQGTDSQSTHAKSDEGNLPDSLFVVPSAAISDEHPNVSSAGVSSANVTIPGPRLVPQFSAPSVANDVENDAELEVESDIELDSAVTGLPTQVPNGASLSDEEAISLAEQLAEAKHEEAQAEADEREDAAGTSLQPFLEAAELEDLQDALHQDHEDDEDDESDNDADHEDAAADADAEADEMHDEAMAAEGSTHHEGEQETGRALHHDDSDQHEDHSVEDGFDPGEEPDEEHVESGAEGNRELHEESHQLGNQSEPGTEHGMENDAEHNAAHVAGQTSRVSEGQQPTSARVSNQPRARFQRPQQRRGGRPQRGGGGQRRSSRPHENRPHSHSHSHSHGRPEQHKRPQLISEMLKAGEEIIVQIAKEPLGKKGARITSHVALPGRFLVYMPTVDHIGVSRRIGSAEDRSRLRRVVTEAKGTFPGGFIVRTAAAEATDDEIRADVEFLGRTWDTIRATSEQRRAPSLLHRDLNLVERILRDYLSEDYVAIWLDNEEEYTKVVEFVGRFQPKMVPRVKLYTKDAPIFEEFGIQQELDKALRPKVWLKSGGYVVINHTEALVAIDVNTGKYVGRGSTRLEDTIVKTNLEAVKEIVRQIRLRDLGGIIVCDFIDMEERRNRDKVMAALDQALSADRAPSKALSFNEFGLVCITRKRTKQALERVLCQPCPYCTGSGMVKSIPTICYEIQAEARKMAHDLDAKSLTLRVNPEIAKTLKTRESSLIDELEQTTRKSIIIQSDPTLHWEQYDIY